MDVVDRAVGRTTAARTPLVPTSTTRMLMVVPPCGSVAATAQRLRRPRVAAPEAQVAAEHAQGR